MLKICYCNYASQPDIGLLCDGSWTTPSWQEKTTHKDIVASLPDECYVGDNGRCYTFDWKLVTCNDCLAKKQSYFDNLQI